MTLQSRHALERWGDDDHFEHLRGGSVSSGLKGSRGLIGRTDPHPPEQEEEVSMNTRGRWRGRTRDVKDLLWREGRRSAHAARGVGAISYDVSDVWKDGPDPSFQRFRADSHVVAGANEDRLGSGRLLGALSAADPAQSEQKMRL